ITDKLSAIGCLKGVLTPVSKTGGSPFTPGFFSLISAMKSSYVPLYIQKIFNQLLTLTLRNTLE
ncbi:hypothetical protein SB724_13980, partial [Bacillus sp. SIMBA_031]|uniref:hypothetical protein n=1 Tax=Bacillus sp. SIMBA_031 TaxID=3085774 RepID=UPI00397D79D6